jgi:undecaprenyl-phosphate 4-deoxy-4-formamido-L-arabinose transferase
MKLSVVIPVFNEEDGLRQLFDELFPVMKKLAVPYEVVFVDDGSSDKSLSILRQEALTRPEMVVVELEQNFGQHQAILAALTVAKGEYNITFDADLQNLPEGILDIYAEMEKGYDYVGSVREKRQDVFWRRFLSFVNNKIREKITNIKVTDQGCMLRGYSRRISLLMAAAQEVAPYLPALGYSFSRRPTEITVKHQHRQAGESKYSLYKLFRLNFDIMTGYSLLPLQIFSMLGMVVAAVSGVFFIVLMARRIFVGPEAEGLFTLFALLFFFMGICLFGLGILGEYVGRVYSEIRKRPRYLIHDVYTSTEKDGRSHE